eukprot:TRINITY_DN8836_c0_g2_i1.p1 TRINITY_DN8836_c0_g2~~TRINITY_DN8836_c0_g2_i1.p1  ORF type:complete len:422 (-),score=19.66 TRINITY_DN8836_c0_g2_i1:359-1483(-)
MAGAIDLTEGAARFSLAATSQRYNPDNLPGLEPPSADSDSHREDAAAESSQDEEDRHLASLRKRTWGEARRPQPPRRRNPDGSDETKLADNRRPIRTMRRWNYMRSQAQPSGSGPAQSSSFAVPRAREVPRARASLPSGRVNPILNLEAVYTQGDTSSEEEEEEEDQESPVSAREPRRKTTKQASVHRAASAGNDGNDRVAGDDEDSDAHRRAASRERAVRSAVTSVLSVQELRPAFVASHVELESFEGRGRSKSCPPEPAKNAVMGFRVDCLDALPPFDPTQAQEASSEGTSELYFVPAAVEKRQTSRLRQLRGLPPQTFGSHRRAQETSTATKTRPLAPRVNCVVDLRPILDSLNLDDDLSDSSDSEVELIG